MTVFGKDGDLDVGFGQIRIKRGRLHERHGLPRGEVQFETRHLAGCAFTVLDDGDARLDLIPTADLAEAHPDVPAGGWTVVARALQAPTLETAYVSVYAELIEHEVLPEIFTDCADSYNGRVTIRGGTLAIDGPAPRHIPIIDIADTWLWKPTTAKNATPTERHMMAFSVFTFADIERSRGPKPFDVTDGAAPFDVSQWPNFRSIFAQLPQVGDAGSWPYQDNRYRFSRTLEAIDEGQTSTSAVSNPQDGSWMQQLRDLAELRSNGALTDDEFEILKRKIMPG